MIKAASRDTTTNYAWYSVGTDTLSRLIWSWTCSFEIMRYMGLIGIGFCRYVTQHLFRWCREHSNLPTVQSWSLVRYLARCFAPIVIYHDVIVTGILSMISYIICIISAMTGLSSMTHDRMTANRSSHQRNHLFTITRLLLFIVCKASTLLSMGYGFQWAGTYCVI